MSGDGRSDAGSGATGFALRFLAALALVLLTYNPTRFAFVPWLRAAVAEGGAGAIHALAGVGLLIGWTFFLGTAWSSLGPLGLLLGAAFLATAVWVLLDYDLLSLESPTAITWVVLACLAALLAFGMSWGHLKRRASGQVEVDEIER
jgi:hypothetical protein